MIFDTTVLSPFEWFSQHMQLIGWPAICYGIWRLRGFLSIVETRVLGAEQHITKMATNCFPTMQASLKNQDTLLHSVDKSLKTLVERQSPTPRRKRK